MRPAVAGFLALALAFPAATLAADPAVEARYTPALQRCLDSPDGMSTHGQIQCVQGEHARQDARLNAAYKAAMADLNARQKARLQAAQRAWIAFRDRNCEAQMDEDWGTLSTVNANFCVLRMTVERTLELEDYPPEG